MSVMRQTCQNPGCTRRAVAHGLCNSHYSRWWRTGELIADDEYRKRCLERNLRPRDGKISEKSLGEKLEEAQGCYRSAIGLQARVFWAAKVKELHALLAGGHQIRIRLDSRLKMSAATLGRKQVLRADWDKAVRMNRAGASDAEIATALGVKQRTVRTRLTELA